MWKVTTEALLTYKRPLAPKVSSLCAFVPPQAPTQKFGACLSPRGKGDGEKRVKQTKQNRTIKCWNNKNRRHYKVEGLLEVLGPSTPKQSYLPSGRPPPVPWRLVLYLVKTPEFSSTKDLICIHSELEPMPDFFALFGLWEISMDYTAASSPYTYQDGYNLEPW